MVRRIFVEKKAPYAVKAKELKNEMSEYLGIEAEEVRVLIRYDVENVSDETFGNSTILQGPPANIYTNVSNGALGFFSAKSTTEPYRLKLEPKKE